MISGYYILGSTTLVIELHKAGYSAQVALTVMDCQVHQSSNGGAFSPKPEQVIHNLLPLTAKPLTGAMDILSQPLGVPPFLHPGFRPTEKLDRLALPGGSGNRE